MVALDEDTFYFSRYEASSTRWGGLLETATMVAWGELVFFNGTYGTAMVSGLIKPSGLATSQDKRYDFRYKRFQCHVSIPDMLLDTCNGTC